MVKSYNIDFIKALAILSVILLHGLPIEVLFDIGAPYHIWQTVPVFIILASYNVTNSYQRKKYVKISQFYGRQNLIGKAKRILLPFLLVYLIQILAYVVIFKELDLKNLIIGLVTGGWGPGSYFIPIIIQS